MKKYERASNISKILKIIKQGNVIINKFSWENNSLLISGKIKDDSKNFTFKFYDVVDLKINTGPYNIFDIVSLYIEDISTYQMEGKKFKSFQKRMNYLFIVIF